MTRPAVRSGVVVIVEDGLCDEVDDVTVTSPVGDAAKVEFWEEVDNGTVSGALGTPGEGVIRRVRVDAMQTSVWVFETVKDTPLRNGKMVVV